MRRNPHVFEAHAHLLSSRWGGDVARRPTLDDIPEDRWRRLARLGFDFVWLMGVWRRSPASREAALADPGLRRAYDDALPGWTEDDVGGSPYAIGEYTLDPALGPEESLPRLRRRLNRLGIGLMVDFVPNHLAVDHPWTLSHPEWFVRPSRKAAARHPGWYFRTKAGELLAHGRDPHFLPWTDTAQVDLLRPAARSAMAEQLLRIGDAADAVRCDMAMLALTAVFEKTWKEALPPRAGPATEFWAELIGPVKRRHPGLRLVAEAYWDSESRLQDLGFDYTYDKGLYDRLLGAGAPAVLEHLRTPAFDTHRAVRFVENHDEARALEAFGPDRSLAAATVIATLPGMRLFHDGQLEGRRVRLPVQLVTEPGEPDRPALAEAYDRLLGFCASEVLHDGEWALLDARPAWEGDDSHRNLLCWSWRHRNQTSLVVVNFGPQRSAGRLGPRWEPPGRDPVVLHDATTGETYTRDARELRDPGLYIELGPWKSHLFEVRD